MADSVRPHRRKPTRLPRPWDSPGKNTGVGCHFLLQCVKVKSEREVAQSCPTLSDPMDCSLPCSSIHGIFQAKYWGGVPLPSPKKHVTGLKARLLKEALLGAGGEGDNRGWDGWMALPTRWTWVWVNSGSWWWTGRPGVLRLMRWQRVGHEWATELNWRKKE